MRLASCQKLCLLAFISLGCFGSTAWARKTNQQVYEEPFDQAAGGASLTRASQEGVMFANPALLPYGGKFHRWLGSQFSVIAAAQSVEFAQEVMGGGGDGGDDPSAIVDAAFNNPIHFGFASTIAYITNNFGLGVFGRFEPDVQARRFGDSGVPQINVTAEAYSGAVTSFALRPLSWLSLGVTAKYLYVGEPDIAVALTDEQRVAELTSDPDALAAAASFGQGMGFDAGLLLFAQGHWLDYRLALKVDDVGDTAFTGSQAAFKQTLHAGLGVTLHNAVDALHLSVDYRDILGAYDEHAFKRLYLGAKLLLRSYVGLAAGVYQGYPTYGVRFDLLLMKIGATVYGRELGDSPGANPRNLYVVYFAVGM